MIYIYLILMSALSALRDQIIFNPDKIWFPIWTAKFAFDPTHSTGGLFTVLMFAIAIEGIPELFGLGLYVSIVIYWLLFYWIRNIFMWIILVKPKYIKWNYLLPFGGF